MENKVHKGWVFVCLFVSKSLNLCCFVVFFFLGYQCLTSLWTVEAVQKLFSETLLIWKRRKSLVWNYLLCKNTERTVSMCRFLQFHKKKKMCSEWEHDRISAVSFSFILLSSQPAWPQVWTLCKLEEVSYKLFRLPNYCIIISIVELLPTTMFWVGQLTQPAPIIRDLQIFIHVISPNRSCWRWKL